MSVYVIMMKLTDQGAKDIKNAPARIDAGMKAWEALGGKVLGFYAMTGEYDYLAIGEGPDDETAVELALTLGLGGNVHTTTARAFTVDEFAEIVKKLP
jgi:uncharacterized protein with GYD domain